MSIVIPYMLSVPHIKSVPKPISQQNNQNTYMSATNVPMISELSGVEATALDIMADNSNAGAGTDAG